MEERKERKDQKKRPEISLTTFNDSNTLNQKIERLSTELKFLSNISSGQKLEGNSKISGITAKFWRPLFGEGSRKQTLDRFSRAINDSISIIEETMGISDPFIAKIVNNLISDLGKIESGLESMKRTYADDSHFAAHIDTLIETTRARIDTLKSS